MARKSKPTPHFTVTLFTNAGQRALSKRIEYKDGKVISDASGCRMANGSYEVVSFGDLHDFARCITNMPSHQALALGAPRPGILNEGQIGTEDKPGGTNNGWQTAATVRRTKENFAYTKARPALVLLDFDTKGIPPDIQAKIAKLGGLWPTLVSVMPELAPIGHVVRASTSAGLAVNNRALPASIGVHVYCLLADGSKAKAFLDTLHKLCWLNGFGWMMIGNAGSVFARSPIDQSVYGGERLVFEGAAVVLPPLRQAPRAAVADGVEALKEWRKLTTEELIRVDKLIADATGRCQKEADAQQAVFKKKIGTELAKRTGISVAQAMKAVDEQGEGVLVSPVRLHFDRDPSIVTVGDVLENPEAFQGRKLADPLEGPAYGATTAIVMLDNTGTPTIRSFAHGSAIYGLFYTADDLRKKLKAAQRQKVIDTWVKLDSKTDMTKKERTEMETFALSLSRAKG